VIDARASAAGRLLAELLGSALLTAIVVGSGIAATSLTTDGGIRLLINAGSTGLGLAVLIAVLGPVSGAHFNPVVSIADGVLGGRRLREVGVYMAAQVAGCLAGAVLANVMFDLPPIAWSTTDRVAPGHLIGEVVATAGLVMVIFCLARADRAAWIPPAVGAYIGAATLFTSSTAFANPAITVGRMFTDTFAGISPASAWPFVIAQLLGGAIGILVARALFPVRAAG
jgi:glycerol uptake facilitator-like aquaporin